MARGCPQSGRERNRMQDSLRQLLESKKRAMGYGLEAMKRLRAGRSIIYSEGQTIVEELPDGRRFEVDYDENYNERRIRELSPALPISDSDR